MRTNFHMEEKYIRMVRGDTLSFGIQIMDETGRPFKQELDNASFTVKLNVADKPLFQKTLANGISKTGNGEYVVRVPPDDTKNAKAGKYFYELEIGVNDDSFTIMHGILELEQDVTF